MAKSPFLSFFIRTVIDRAATRLKQEGKSYDMDDIRAAVDETLAKDETVVSTIKDVQRELGGESHWVTNTRNALRPMISMILTLAFLGLMIFGGITLMQKPEVTLGPDIAVSEMENYEKLKADLLQEIDEKQVFQYDRTKDMLAIFMAVYGPILGFWFGEHTAMKGRKEEAQVRETLEQLALSPHGGGRSRRG